MELAALTAFLAPFLPYLLKAGRTAADQAADELGTEGWKHAKRLWAKLRPRVEAEPAPQEAAEELAAKPDDARAQRTFERELAALLEGDEELAAELERLWADAKSANVVVARGDRSVASSGEIRDSTIITGDDVKIER